MKKAIDTISHAASLFMNALISELPIILLCYLVTLMPTTFSDIFAWGPMWFFMFVFPQPFIISIMVGVLAHCKKWIFHALSVIIILIYCAELFCYLCQGCRVTTTIFIIILQSNPAETGEYLTGDAYIIRNIVITLLSAATLLVAVNVGSRLWRKSGICHRLSGFLDRHRTRTILLAAFTLFLSFLSIFAIYRVLNKDYNYWWQRSGYNHVLITPITIWKAWEDALIEASQMDLDRIQEAIDKITIEQVEQQDSLTIIYIIGESHIKHRMSSYGYYLNTYPKIDSLISRDEIMLFDNVITIANGTRDMFPKLMSTHVFGNTTNDFNDAPLIPAVMKKAGYDVSFYSNQSLVKIYKHFDFGCYYILGKSSIVDSSFDNLNTKTKPYDDMLIKEYPPTSNKKLNFIIYHLYGQHFFPSERIPDWWKREFTRDNYSDLKHFDDHQPKMMADYDNASQYNDYVLSEIISMVSDKNAIVVYTPDHGEESYDWQNLSGRTPNWNLPGTIKTVFEVPLFIWLSPRYSAAHPEIAEMLRANVDKPIYNCDISHTIMQLAGIHSNALRPEFSLLNTEVPEIRKNRTIGLDLTVNYDSIKETVKNTTLIYEFKSAKKLP